MSDLSDKFELNERNKMNYEEIKALAVASVTEVLGRELTGLEQQIVHYTATIVAIKASE